MTFETLEQSNRDGKPIALYKFIWGNSSWCYTSADRQITVGADDYEPIAIGDDGLKQNGANPADTNFTVRLPADLPVVALFRATPPSNPVVLLVRKKHDGDAEAPLHWTGRVTNARRKTPVEAEIVCKYPGLKRAGLRLTWCRECPHFVYDPGCQLDKADFAETHTISMIDGNVITLNAVDHADDNYYDMGFIEWDADGLGTIESRGVDVGLGGSVLQLFGRGDGLEVGQSVTLYPGCDGRSVTCDEKFDNLANLGSFEFMPGESPFDGRQVF